MDIQRRFQNLVLKLPPPNHPSIQMSINRTFNKSKHLYIAVLSPRIKSQHGFICLDYRGLIIPPSPNGFTTLGLR